MEETAEQTSVSLFPTHKRIVSEFGARGRRSFSNALQIIIEEWAKEALDLHSMALDSGELGGIAGIQTVPRAPISDFLPPRRD